MNLNRFEAAEYYARERYVDILAEKAKTKKINNLIFTDISGFDGNDLRYKEDGIDVIVEIKIRHMKSNLYKDYILEYNKYISLKEFICDNINVTYVNLFDDGVCLEWNINNLNNLIWESSYYNKCTVKGNQKIEKKVTMLNSVYKCELWQDTNYMQRDWYLEIQKNKHLFVHSFINNKVANLTREDLHRYF